jgi:class 3 adenylate cyclase
VDLSPWEEAGLYDPDASDAAERRDLLAYLAGMGFTLDDVAEATRDHRIGLLAAGRILWGDDTPRHTIDDVARESGVDVAKARRIIRAAGIPVPDDEPAFRDIDARFVASFEVGAQVFGDDAVLQFTRVLGASAARVAEAAVALFTATVSPRLVAACASDLEHVRTGAEAVQAFSVVPGAMDLLVREHFIAAMRRLGMLDAGEGGTTAVAVAFVDLVDSSGLSRSTAPHEWTAALNDFESAAMEAALSHDCRVVKLIGDEVMLAGGSTVSTLAVVDEVLTCVDHHPVLGGARAGVAAGWAIARDGDYFGPVVNLAARLTDMAGGGEMLVDDAVARAASGDGYTVEDAGPLALKGFDTPVPAARVTRSRRN